LTKKRFQAIINIGVPRFWEKLMVITFVGHSKLYMTDCLVEKIENTIFNKISGADKIKFYCGGYGDFDNLCLKACHLIRQSGVHCEIVLVTPYITQSQQKKTDRLLQSNLYDYSIFPPIESTPYKFAISKRNDWMVDNSDLIIAYVKFTHGGAYKTLQYAYKRKKAIINLAEN